MINAEVILEWGKLELWKNRLEESVEMADQRVILGKDIKW